MHGVGRQRFYRKTISEDVKNDLTELEELYDRFSFYTRTRRAKEAEAKSRNNRARNESMVSTKQIADNLFQSETERDFTQVVKKTLCLKLKRTRIVEH